MYTIELSLSFKGVFHLTVYIANTKFKVKKTKNVVGFFWFCFVSFLTIGLCDSFIRTWDYIYLLVGGLLTFGNWMMTPVSINTTTTTFYMFSLDSFSRSKRFQIFRRRRNKVRAVVRSLILFSSSSTILSSTLYVNGRLSCAKPIGLEKTKRKLSSYLIGDRGM